MTEPTEQQLEEVTNLVKEMARRYLLLENGVASDLEDLSKPELQVLELIALYHADTVSKIAQVAQLPISSASWLANNLVEKQYLSRHTDSEDRRVQRLELAERGNEVLSFLENAFSEMAKEILQAATEEEAHALVALSRRLSGSLRMDTQPLVGG
jgi:DNA-binding MarR family transcriptional regulator